MRYFGSMATTTLILLTLFENGFVPQRRLQHQEDLPGAERWKMGQSSGEHLTVQKGSFYGPKRAFYGAERDFMVPRTILVVRFCFFGSVGAVVGPEPQTL